MARQGINTGSSPDAGDGDALLTGALKINANFSEIYAAIGDGTNITNVIGYAVTAGISTYSNLSRITIKDSGSTVGTAGTIDFGVNLSVSAISAGVVTVTGGTTSQWTSTAAGIHTLSNVGIGTTNPTSALTVKGNTSLETLNVSGVSTFRNNVNFGTQCSISTTGNNLRISADGDITLSSWQGSTQIISQPGANLLSVDASDVSLYYQVSAGPSGSEKRLQTLGAGVTVTGTTFTNQLSVSGVSTFSGNVRVGVDTSTGVILTSPNGTQYRLIVADNGTLNTVAV